MLEIDIDIGRFVAVFGDEAVEQQCMLRWVDRGDAEAEAHRRIGGAAAPLTQDWRIDPARIVDDILDGEEVSREIELADQRQFTLDRVDHLQRHATGIIFGRITAFSTPPGLHFEEFLRPHPGRVDLFGIFVTQLVEREVTSIRNFARSSNRMRPALEQFHHHFGRFEVTFAITVEQVPCPRHRGLVTDRRHHILQRALVRRRIMYVIGGKDREAVRLGERIKPGDPGDVVPAVEIARRNMVQRGELCGQAGKEIGYSSAGILPHRCAIQPHHVAFDPYLELCLKIIRRQQDQLHILAMIHQHGERDVTFALLLPFAVKRLHPASADQTTQTSVCRAGLRVSEKGQTLDRLDPAADHRTQLERARLAMHSHHAGHRIGIGDPDRVIALRMCSSHEVHRIAGSTQEAETAHQPQFHKGRGHGRLDQFGIKLDPALVRSERRIRHICSIYVLILGTARGFLQPAEIPPSGQLRAPASIRS